MKKILLLNGGKQFAHSDGRYNATLHDAAVAFLDRAGCDIKTTFIDGGYDIEEEVQKFLWADVVIYQMPEVQDVAVIGLPDARWGERPVAIVVPKAGRSLDYAMLEKHCRAHLAGFKVPAALHLRDSLPRNPSGKILKRTLREDFSAKG